MKYIKLLTLFIFTITFRQVIGQTCQGYENKCSKPPKDYKVSSLSKSFSLERMKIVNINLTLYGNRAYYFSVAGKGRLGKLHYRLLENTRNRLVLFDNASVNYIDSKIFEIESTINVVLEITAPNFHEEDVRECAGVLVGFKQLD